MNKNNNKTFLELLKESEELDKQFLSSLRKYGFKFKNIIEAGEKAEEILKIIGKN